MSTLTISEFKQPEPEYPYFAKFGNDGLVYITGFEEGMYVHYNNDPNDKGFRALGRSIGSNSFSWSSITPLPKGTVITITT